MIKKVWKRSESSGLDERLSIWMHKLDQWRKKYSYENPCHDQRMLREIILEYAADLETQAKSNQSTAHQLREKHPNDYQQNGNWHQLADNLERSARHYRTTAGALRLQVALASEEPTPELVASLQRQVRRLRMLSGWLSIGLAFLLAAFWAMISRGWG